MSINLHKFVKITSLVIYIDLLWPQTCSMIVYKIINLLIWLIFYFCLLFELSSKNLPAQFIIFLSFYLFISQSLTAKLVNPLIFQRNEFKIIPLTLSTDFK